MGTSSVDTMTGSRGEGGGAQAETGRQGPATESAMHPVAVASGARSQTGRDSPEGQRARRLPHGQTFIV
jgi:hypothetical protein